MFARLAKILVIVLLVVSTGLHWAALQTVAWTTMLANNLRTQGVTEAVAQTFDGRHLCPLCRAIAAAKKSEQKSAAVAPVLKMEFPPAAKLAALIPPGRFEILPLHNAFAQALSFPPASPPPRPAAA